MITYVAIYSDVLPGGGITAPHGVLVRVATCGVSGTVSRRTWDAFQRRVSARLESSGALSPEAPPS